jgi:hypothetical protein
MGIPANMDVLFSETPYFVWHVAHSTHIGSTFCFHFLYKPKTATESLIAHESCDEQGQETGASPTQTARISFG